MLVNAAVPTPGGSAGAWGVGVEVTLHRSTRGSGPLSAWIDASVPCRVDGHASVGCVAGSRVPGVRHSCMTGQPACGPAVLSHGAERNQAPPWIVVESSQAEVPSACDVQRQMSRIHPRCLVRESGGRTTWPASDPGAAHPSLRCFTSNAPTPDGERQPSRTGSAARDRRHPSGSRPRRIVPPGSVDVETVGSGRGRPARVRSLGARPTTPSDPCLTWNVLPAIVPLGGAGGDRMPTPAETPTRIARGSTGAPRRLRRSAARLPVSRGTPRLSDGG